MTNDDALRDRLRAADPASGAAPLDPTWFDSTMEYLMTTHTNPTDTNTATTARRSGRPRWLAPAAGATGAAAIAAIAIPLALGAGGASAVTALDLPGDPGLAAGSCPVISAEVVAMNDTAVAATVLSIEGDTVILEVTERFAGDVDDRLSLTQVEATDGDFSGVPFTVGDAFLIGATDGTVALCGVTGVDDANLRSIYLEAFGN